MSSPCQRQRIKRRTRRRMKIMREKTSEGMFFGIHVSQAELEYDYPHFTRMFIRDAIEDPTASKIFMMLEAMASILEDVESRNDNWQELLELEEQEISDGCRKQ